MSNIDIDCNTQAQVDAAAANGDIAVVRAGQFSVGGSAVVYAHGSAVVTAHDSAVVIAYDSVVVYAHGSAVVTAKDSAVVRAYDSVVVYVYHSAVVYANESARVLDGATKVALRSDRPRVIISPIGSRGDVLGVSLPADGSDPHVYAGCWHGTLAAFEERVASVYPTGRYGGEYRAAIAFIRALAATNEEAKR